MRSVLRSKPAFARSGWLNLNRPRPNDDNLSVPYDRATRHHCPCFAAPEDRKCCSLSVGPVVWLFPRR